MFILSTYLDGERWESGLEPLLYPSGMSFYRPFSYRKGYFHPEIIADQLSDISQRDPLMKSNWNKGFFGVRFLSAAYPDYTPLFIPLRAVSLLTVDASDQINLTFKLGPFISPTFVNGDAAHKEMPKVDLRNILPNPSETRFFISLRTVDEEGLPKWELKSDFPPGMWEALERTVSPAAKEKIRNTVLSRLVRVRKRGQPTSLPAMELDAISRSCGFQLYEGTAYDLLLSYFRIVEPGVPDHPIEHQLVLTNPTDELQASRRSIQINANYRTEEIWIRPKSAGPGPILISFETSKLGETKLAEPRVAKMLGLKFPVLVKPKRWSATRKWNAVLAVLSLLGLLACLRKYPGSADALQKVILLIIAALVSLLINSVKDLLMPGK